ncbi:peptidase A4 family-domain-containing protein [Xylaria bambusicola]|uniref:peptidase A4 family-domain-containing protein n=1 Tax=Xylaria bambusicola TaxID=326684 RepID=UPI0020089C98|nr:peptidase A4 family-domain-containing protein [Xylaria bambusicola]KAI0505212.1 peptidase A4 family-domain-containing protein [Xylaria bambusicola]
MKVILVASVLAWVGATVAAPGYTRRRRADELSLRRTSLPQFLDSERSSLLVDNSTHAEYTTNWAGAVMIGSGYTTVSGTIVVPKPSIPLGGSSTRTYSASAWVGIDGSTCQTAILQTGVDFSTKGKTVTYEGWYEWYPDYSYKFPNFKISGGDTVTMTATVTSKNGGSVTLENKTTGQSVTHVFTNQLGNLCQTNAEWIVEDFSQGNVLVPFADFGTVVFTNASANGVTQLDKALIYDIKQGNKVYTSCSTSSSSSVTCSYVG